ncbi:MAG TPA: FtsX-like permease family protein [Marmoricola sp.]|nr:FtsX-like permease family protein [Marmoricola sp.]
MSPWRPAIRMARRDLRRHKLRAALTCLLVALPVVVATVAALGSYNSRWDREQQARSELGSADARLHVTPFAAVKPKPALWMGAKPAEFEVVDGERRPVRRDRSDVDVTSLLPAGSTVVPQYSTRFVPLATGGQASVNFMELGLPLNEPYAELVAGRAPTGPDEVAVTEVVADELGMLEEGEPADDAVLTLADGSTLPVVGVVDPAEYADEGGLYVVASTDSALMKERPRAGWFVDLPPVSRAELKDAVAAASAAGVLMRPRDAILDPGAWGLDDSESFDAGAVVVGAMAVLVGLLEVVLLVGAAFAVAARRQVRDLGLLAANGGAAPDVRRVLLAQGIVLGVGSSLVGVLVGVAAFRGLLPLWERVLGREMWRQELDWWALGVVFVLGALTSVVAALLPGWNVSRLTPVAALSGRFPVRPGEAKAHRGAFVLAATGLLLLLAGGWATARTFGPGGREESLAPAAAGLGLVLLLVGAVWATPYVVRRVAATGQTLSLSGRYAFRDAARHRFRSTAAVMALMVTVAGAVLAGFAFASVAEASKDRGYAPANSLEVNFGDLRPQRVAAVTETVEGVVGPVELQRTAGLTVEGTKGVVLVAGRAGGELRAADEATIRDLARGDETALQAFRDGAVVLVGGEPARRAVEADGTVRTRVTGARTDSEQATRWQLPAVFVNADADQQWLVQAFVSYERAEELGMEPSWTTLVFRTSDPVTDGQLDRLSVYGINAWSDDPERLLVDRMQFAGLGIAGLLSLVVVGVAVAMAAAESRDDVATLAAVGAGPWRRRSMGAMHGLFLGLVGAGLGAAVGVPAGAALTQVDGLAGVDVPWLATSGTLLVVLLAAPVAGWVVTPSRLRLTRRTA